jgi:hypothetical protein
MLPKVRIKLVLEPIDRVLEVLGGVIMVLTFTSALSVSRAGQADVREMLIGSLGCNVACGIIDAIMYLMNCLAARGHEHDALRGIRSVRNAEEARQAISKGLPEAVAAVLSLQVSWSAFTCVCARCQSHPPDHAWRATIGLAQPAFFVWYFSRAPRNSPLCFAFRASASTKAFKLYCRLHAVSHWLYFRAKHFRGGTNHE